jgi:hypothetical protein
VDTLALVDHTREHRPDDGVLDAIAEALTIQIQRDFAPAWGVRPRRVTVGGRGDKLHFFDHAHQATDFGWHIVDSHGAPYAHVFAAVSMSHGSGWTSGPDAISVTASHEALEMLGDPAANEYVFNGQRRLWSREVCDPVQSNTYNIVAGHLRVAVSNFVLPAFFNPWAPAPYDHLGVLTEPFSLARGGYAVVERATATHSRNARRVDVTFDRSVPQWQRSQKREGWGRTYWRLVLGE